MPRSTDGGDYDACVIGGGPAGAVTAATLAGSGLRVLLLEQGRRWPPGTALEHAETGWDRAYTLDRDGGLHLDGRPWTAQAVGGGAAFFGGIFFRYRRLDFDVRKFVAADAMDPRWPIGYDELRTHYDDLERTVGVARSVSLDPWEPEGVTPVMRPHRYSRAGEVLADAGRRIGLRPFPTPLAINTRPYAGRPACTRATPCNGYTCPSGAKADPAAVLLDRFRDDDRLTVSARSRALRLVQSGPRRVGAVEWVDLDRRQRRRSRAGCFIATANAVQSAALLLRSGSRWSPSGLGNQRDMVGRGLSFKVSGYVTGAVPAPVTADRATGPFSTVSFTDHYTDPDCPTGLGGTMYEASPADRRPTGGLMSVRLHHIAGDQPCARNRVRLANSCDRLGVPRVVLDYKTHPVDRLRLRYLAEQATHVLTAAGARDITVEESGYERGSSHLHGGCRAGEDPATSVVDVDGRLWDLDNVFVFDGGYFPYSGGVNPTFTILANALRMSRTLAAELGRPRS